MTVSNRVIASAWVAVLFVVGCSPYYPDQIVPPKMASPAPMPAMHFPESAATGSTIRLDVEVVVDGNGRPVMSTFKANGPAATENRDALYEWIGNSTFRPAFHNGQPVSGVYHSQVQLRVP
jgi:hypothetical protein